jgi:aspartyl-tRNA(Asn)/glutamyl-tRNA(Gln) amidotransferase subunit C
MLSKEKVKHIAKLARVSLTEREIGKYQKDLSSILGYVEKLKGVDVSKIEPTSHSTKVENVMRDDAQSKEQDAADNELLDLAPETKNGYLKVKKVF